MIAMEKEDGLVMRLCVHRICTIKEFLSVVLRVGMLNTLTRLSLKNRSNLQIFCCCSCNTILKYPSGDKYRPRRFL